MMKMKTVMYTVALLAACSLVANARGDLFDRGADIRPNIHAEKVSEESLLEETLPYAEGEFKRLIAAGPDKYAIHCAENPESACYEYNVQERWVRLCDGEGTMIGYVVSVEYVGSYTDPETGEYISVYDVTTGTD
jgi:hypothetical protein